jgi:tetratricopeptide (TPR) repeat protein
MLIYREIGNEKGESMALNSLGVLLSEQGQLHEARAYLEQSLDLKRKIGHRRAVNTTLHNLGFIAYRMGRYGEAARRFGQVLEYAIEAGDLEAQADAYFSLGSVNTHLGSYPTAEDQLDKAMLTYRQIDEKNGVCITHIQQAILADHRGDRVSALALSQEALALAKELNLKRELAEAFTYAGNFLLSMARIDEASEHLQEAQELWQELGDLRILAEVRAACAHVCLAGGNQAEALAQVEQVLECLTGQAQASTRDIQEMTFSSLEGMVEPFAALLHCCIVLESIGDARAQPLRESACRLLLEQASWVDDESLRKSFLENVPANREITSRCN